MRPLGEHPALTDMLNRVISMKGRSEKWTQDSNTALSTGESINDRVATINSNSTETVQSDLRLKRLFQELLTQRFVDEDDYELDRIGHLTVFNTAFNSRIGEGI